MRGLTFRTAVSVLSIAAAISLSPRADAATLTGYLQSEAGPLNAVIWTIGITNPTSMDANVAAISSFTLTQVSGAACTPVATLGGSIGTIAANTTASANVYIDFTGCAFDPGGYPFPPPPTGATFDLQAMFVANGFTGSLVLDNLLATDDGTVYPALAATPLPPSSMLFGSALLGLAALLILVKRRPAPSTLIACEAGV